MIELKKDNNIKNILKNENANKIVDVFGKNVNFNKQQSGKGPPSNLGCMALVAKVSDNSNLKILTLKQMLQRSPIAFAQAKAGNTSGNLPN